MGQRIHDGPSSTLPVGGTNPESRGIPSMVPDGGTGSGTASPDRGLKTVPWASMGEA